MLGVRAGFLPPHLYALSANVADTPFPFGGAALDDFNFQHDEHLSPLWKRRLAPDQNKLTRFANSRPGFYFRCISKAFEFCIPTRGTEVPARAERRTAFSSRRLNRARSARTCFGRPATWAWRVWYRSAEIGPIVLRDFVLTVGWFRP